MNGSEIIGIAGATFTCTRTPAFLNCSITLNRDSVKIGIGSILRSTSRENGVIVKCIRAFGRVLIRSMSSNTLGLRVKIPTFVIGGVHDAINSRAFRVSRYLSSAGWYGSVMVPITNRVGPVFFNSFGRRAAICERYRTNSPHLCCGSFTKNLT